jgi:hypothetical protein
MSWYFYVLSLSIPWVLCCSKTRYGHQGNLTRRLSVGVCQFPFGCSVPTIDAHRPEVPGTGWYMREMNMCTCTHVFPRRPTLPTHPPRCKPGLALAGTGISRSPGCMCSLLTRLLDKFEPDQPSRPSHIIKTQGLLVSSESEAANETRVSWKARGTRWLNRTGWRGLQMRPSGSTAWNAATGICPSLSHTLATGRTLSRCLRSLERSAFCVPSHGERPPTARASSL